MYVCETPKHLQLSMEGLSEHMKRKMRIKLIHGKDSSDLQARLKANKHCCAILADRFGYTVAGYVHVNGYAAPLTNLQRGIIHAEKITRPTHRNAGRGNGPVCTR